VIATRLPAPGSNRVFVPTARTWRRSPPVVGQNIGRHAGRGSPVKPACAAMTPSDA